MTPKQRELLDFIEKYVSERRCPPSFEEMRGALGLQSKSGVSRLVWRLVDQGHLRRTPGGWRNFELANPLASISTKNLRAELARRGEL